MEEFLYDEHEIYSSNSAGLATLAGRAAALVG